MYKACSRCGRIHPASFICNKGKVYAGGEERKLRNKYAWALKSQQIREDSQNLCAVCRDIGVYTYDNLEVHHIEKLAEHPEKLLDDDNLICLCVEHHKQADRGELDKDYLKKLAQGRG